MMNSRVVSQSFIKRQISLHLGHPFWSQAGSRLASIKDSGQESLIAPDGNLTRYIADKSFIAGTRSFATTGARGARGLGWYKKYREGKGGRHLQGKWYKEKHPDSVEYRAQWNDAIFSLNKNTSLMENASKVHGNESKNGIPTHVYMDIIGEDWEKPQRIVIELAVAALPRTCSNFIHLCESRDGPDGSVPGYNNTFFHKIEKKVALCGGDVFLKNGNAGKCHPSFSELPNGYTFLDEAFLISHSAGTPGIVSMASPGVHLNDSRFFITLSGTEHHLNGKFVAFGRVVNGLSVVQELGNVFTKRGRPANDIKIVSCGSLVMVQDKGQTESVQNDEDDTVHSSVSTTISS